MHLKFGDVLNSVYMVYWIWYSCSNEYYS